MEIASFEGVCLTHVILTPGACGMGVRAAGPATTSVTSAACSQNADLAAIRVTSELARSEDPFVRCAGCGVGKGPGAPVHARAPQNQLSSEKHTWFGRLVFVFLPDGAQRPIFTMNYHLRDDTVFDIFVSNWQSPFLAPGPPPPDRRPPTPDRRPPSDDPPTRPRGAQALYIQTPDQPPLAAVMLCAIYMFYVREHF